MVRRALALKQPPWQEILGSATETSLQAPRLGALRIKMGGLSLVGVGRIRRGVDHRQEVLGRGLVHDGRHRGEHVIAPGAKELDHTPAFPAHSLRRVGWQDALRIQRPVENQIAPVAALELTQIRLLPGRGPNRIEDINADLDKVVQQIEDSPSVWKMTFARVRSLMKMM